MLSKSRRINAILAAIFLAGYVGAYLTLRCTGAITRYENRGTEERNVVKANVSEWNELIPSLGKLESIAVDSINLIFYPLERIEEIAHNLSTSEPPYDLQKK